MIWIFVNVIAAVFLAMVVTIYMYSFELEEDAKKRSFVASLAAKRKLLIITEILFIGYSIFCGILSNKNGYNGISLLRNLIFLDSLYLLSLTDIKKHIIPNKVIVADLVIRAVFLVLEALFVSDDPIIALENAGIGFLISIIAALVLLLISRGNMGGGDIKLIAILGLYTGAAKAFAVIFFSFVFCAVASLVLLITKKRTFKERIPFAPFVFAGMFVYITFMYLTVNK